MSHHKLDIAERWFARYGAVAVFFSRMLPIVRTFISLPAGMARMPFWRFTLYTALGCIPWVLMLGWIGVAVGDNWEVIEGYMKYFDYFVAACIIGLIVWAVVRWARRRSRPTDGAADGPAGPHGALDAPGESDLPSASMKGDEP
jgi:membrane protein DedA with SNARE-associated domain